MNTRQIVFLLIGVVCLFAALTGDPPATFVTASLKGKKPEYKQLELPNLSAIQLAPKADSGSPTGYTGGGSATAQAAIRFALAQVGKPYKWGATGPDAYDCSGLVYASYKAAGVILPRVTTGQAAFGTLVLKNNLIPGDLVFPDPGHVQIYLGNGQVVEAPHSGTNVRVTNMWGFWTARRITNGGLKSV